MHGELKKSTMVVALAAAIAQQAGATLFDVDLGPYLPENGNFAAWYQDSHGRTLELCLSKTQSSRVPGTAGAPSYMCALLPQPGIFDDTQPIVFPSNFPDEAFWFTGDAEIDDPASGIGLTYVSALEAAFAVEEPAEGDQVSFARIRIRVDVPQPGIYTVTHPYGVEVFNVTQEIFDDSEGDRAINMTRDIGIAAPGTFSGALAGDIGPFLRSVNGPYTETNPETGAQESFIGDPNLEEEVTGSPFGTHYVRIEGPNGIDLRTNLFAVSGRLSNLARPTPLQVERATYSRRTEGGELVAQQDVFVQAPPKPALAALTDSVGSRVSMSESSDTGAWYAQTASNPLLPASVQVEVDNRPALPSSQPASQNAALTDLVTITRAEYRMATGQLSVEASTSDEVSPPGLSLLSASGAPIGALAGNGASKSLTTSVTPIPPARVQVASANGGSDSEEVVIIP